MIPAARAALWVSVLIGPLAAAAPPAPSLTGPDPGAEIRAWDAAHGVSDSARWRSVMSWRSVLDTPLTWSTRAPERAPARYPTPAGAADPAADLVASILQARADPEFGCRFPLRADALADLGVIERPTALTAGRCAAFEAWAQIDRIAGIEVIYATPSFAELATSAGHILFRVRAVPGPTTAPALERVWSYGVDLSRPEARDNMTLKGLVGRLRGELLTEDATTLERRYAQVDRRDLRVYDLILDDRELRRLLARMWTQERDESAARYAFFSTNCARLTHDTLRAAVPELPAASGWFMHPHEVLTELWRAGRLRLRGTVYSWRSRARRAERRRDAVAADLAALPGFTAAHHAATRSQPDRGRAYAAIGRPADPALRAALTEWADATLDVELYLADRATRPREAAAANPEAGPNPEASPNPGAGPDPVTTPNPDSIPARDPAPVATPALDAALRLRARLPPASPPRLEPPAPYAIGPSGSRRATVSGGFDGAAAITRLRLGVVDEQPGEARAVALRRSGRFEFLLTETTLAWPIVGESALDWPTLDWPALDAVRLTVLSTVDYGLGVRSVSGPLAARLHPIVDLGLDAAPRHGVLFGGWLRVGEGLTLIAAEHDRGFWVVGVDARARFAALDRSGLRAALRGEVGGLTELIAPLGDHHLRLAARVAPGWALDGYALHGSGEARLDALFWPTRPLFVSPYGRWHADDRRRGWEAGLAISF